MRKEVELVGKLIKNVTEAAFLSYLIVKDENNYYLIYKFGRKKVDKLEFASLTYLCWYYSNHDFKDADIKWFFLENNKDNCSLII